MTPQIVQISIAAALVLIALKMPWQEASAQQHITGIVGIQGIDKESVEQLSSCIAYKIKEGSGRKCF
jgi:hypothetical protein